MLPRSVWIPPPHPIAVASWRSVPCTSTALGTKSGSDVVGVTHTSTTFYFADMAVGSQPGGGTYSSFLPILNPGTTAANVTATYYAGGKPVGTQTLTVAAGSRGTIFPSQAVAQLASPRLGGADLQPAGGERATHLLQWYHWWQRWHRLRGRRCDRSTTTRQRLALCRRLHGWTLPGERRAGQSRSCQQASECDHHAGV